MDGQSSTALYIFPRLGNQGENNKNQVASYAFLNDRFSFNKIREYLRKNIHNSFEIKYINAYGGNDG